MQHPSNPVHSPVTKDFDPTRLWYYQISLSIHIQQVLKKGDYTFLSFQHFHPILKFVYHFYLFDSGMLIKIDSAPEEKQVRRKSKPG